MVVVAHVGNRVFSEVFTNPNVFGGWAPTDPLLRMTAGGMYGVEFFFVISGFVLALPFASCYVHGTRQVRLGSYYLRRVTRLEPPYLLSLTLILLLSAAFLDKSFSQMLPHFFAGTIYSHNVIFGRFNPVSFVTWSLEVEIQFYLVVPLLVSVFRIRHVVARRGVIVGAALTAMLVQSLCITNGSRLSLTLLNFVQYFLMGFLLADVYLSRSQIDKAVSWRWDLAWAGAGLLLVVAMPSARLGAWLFPFAAFLICLSAFRGPLARRFTRNPWIFTIGGMCYSIYLLHVITITFAIQLTKSASLGNHIDANLILQVILLLPFVLAVSALFFVLVERPCKNKRWPQDLAARMKTRRPSRRTLRADRLT
jgi:peptidoglycan/LPS O-acetylase OafA/YrhL